MDSRDDKMSGDSSIDGKFSTFYRPNLADHDDIGIVSEDTLESLLECVSNRLIDLRLRHSGDLIFDRIF